MYQENSTILETRKRHYHYATCCIHSTAEAINAMQVKAVEVTYRTFRRRCHGLDAWARQMGYAVAAESGLHLKNDWAICFYRSTYRGRKCYYLVHSAIEYIWVLSQ